MILAKALVFAALVCIAGVLLRSVGAFQLKGAVASLSEWTEVFSVSAESKPRGSDACQAENSCKGRDKAQENEGSLFTSIKERIQRKLKVSWVRRRPGSEELQLLTVGRQTYSGDERYAVSFQYPDNWRLTVRAARPQDQGDYECQVSTHPPRTVRYNLLIRAPEVEIVDERGRPLSDKYYEPNSTIQLSCIARRRQAVVWRHGDVTLNYGTPRGGISVRTDLSPAGANSSLLVARVGSGDAGNYTCAVSPSELATVTVHVLDGEHPAELHLSLSPRTATRWQPCSLVLLLLILVLKMGS